MLMDATLMEVDLIQLLSALLAIMHNLKHCIINYMVLTITPMERQLQQDLMQPRVMYPEVSITSMDIQFKDLVDNTNRHIPSDID